MSCPAPSVDKGMNTVLVCQESYACGGSDEASFECDECGSLQCPRCELELHRQERMRNHDRVRVAPGHVPFCDSCKGDAAGGARLRAVIRCQGCKINLCLDCQKRTHSGANKRKHPLTQYPPPKAVPEGGGGDVGDGEAEVEALKAQVERVCSFLLVDDREEMQVNAGLGSPRLFCRRFEFALQKGLEGGDTFLSTFDTFLREPITKLAFPPWRGIGWFNIMTTGKRRQAANCAIE